MTNSQKTCCYRSPEHLLFGRKNCQFMGEAEMEAQLVEVGALWFCPYHLPYSSTTLKEDYEVEVEVNQRQLKTNWRQERIDIFDDDISRRLKNATKDTMCELTGIVFPGNANFSERTMPAVNFTDCRFAGGNAFFDDAKFTGHTTLFLGAQFSGGAALFDNAQFSSKHVNFAGAQFSSEETHFNGAQFSSEFTCFSNTQFLNRETHFNGAQFLGGDTQFDGAQFSGGGAFFENAEFSSGRTFFRNAIFSGGEACFKAVEFSGGSADFEGAEFSGGAADFQNANFADGDTFFRDTKFTGGTAFFVNAKFSGTAYFDGSRTPETNDQSDYNFTRAQFHNATFFSDVWFNNQKFAGATDFRNVTFAKAPEFHGCILHQDTIFPPIGNFRDTGDNAAARAYRTLRLAMKQQEAHEEEAMFWALEQRSKRHQLGKDLKRNWFPWTLSWGYDLVSEYGLNATRPLGWLLGWTLFFAFFIYDNLNEKTACWANHEYADQWMTIPGHTLFPKIWTGCEQVMELSIAQIARPFYIWGGDSASFTTKLFATLDSTVSLTLIALFILAVRRRFRMQ